MLQDKPCLPSQFYVAGQILPPLPVLRCRINHVSGPSPILQDEHFMPFQSYVVGKTLSPLAVLFFPTNPVATQTVIPLPVLFYRTIHISPPSQMMQDNPHLPSQSYVTE